MQRVVVERTASVWCDNATCPCGRSVQSEWGGEWGAVGGWSLVRAGYIDNCALGPTPHHRRSSLILSCLFYSLCRLHYCIHSVSVLCALLPASHNVRDVLQFYWSTIVCSVPVSLKFFFTSDQPNIILNQNLQNAPEKQRTPVTPDSWCLVVPSIFPKFGYLPQYWTEYWTVRLSQNSKITERPTV